MRNRNQARPAVRTRPALEALESRVVPAVVLDYDLVAKNQANFSAKSLIVQLPDGAKPDYAMGAYAPGLKLSKAYPLVPGMYQATLTDQGLVKTLDALKASSRVQLVQPDAKITAQMIPNDARFSELWGMNNTGQTGGAFDADIDAAEAWDKATGTGQTVVAVIDTGVDYNHPDLKANIWTNTREVAGNGKDDDGNGYIDDIRGYDFVNNDADPMDDNGHGTHVSGTIGAVGNNGIGVAGVNWGVKIMPLKFLGADGSGYLSGAIDAVNYAVANGAKLSNNSWGGGPYDATLGKAISNAAAKGHIFVAAAGNDSQNNDSITSYPSGYNYDNIVAVAAVDHLDNLAYFSNYGVNTVDIAAPGVNILSTLPGNQYGSYSGTSMATPHVTGALSLYWDANPNATYKEVISALYQSADTVSTLTNYVGGGGRRLNVAKLLGVSNNPGPDVTGAKVTSGAFTLTAGQATGATLTFSEAIDPASFTTADVSLNGPSGSLSITSVQAVTGSGNTKFTVGFAALTANGTYTLKVGPQVNDLAGNPMDQNSNGVNGEASDTWSADWVISPPPADKTGARVTAGKFTLTNNLATGAALTFSEAIDPASFTLDDIRLAGPAGTISVSSVQPVAGSGNTQFSIAFPALTAAGTYTLTVGPAVLDTAGNPMDQNANGVNGESSDSWSANWVINAQPPADTAGAKVTSGQWILQGGLVTGVRLNFSEAIAPASFTPADVSLAGPNGPVAVTSVRVVTGTGNRQFLITFGSALQDVGTYLLKVGPQVNDLAGNPMDQNSNGVNGEASDTWSADWVISPPPADKTGARVTAGKFTLTNNLATGAALTFSEAIDPASFTLDDIRLAGPAGTISVSSVQPVAGSGNTQFSIAFPALTAAGTYTLTVGPAVLDTAGNPMDQNANGVNGESSDSWSANWVINAQPPADTAGAKVTSGQWILQGGLVTGVRLNFSEAIAPASFTPADVSLAGPNGPVAVTSVRVVTGTGNRQFLITFGSALQDVGTYLLKVGPQVNDLAGNPMDQNSNGVNGEADDAFSTEWVVKPPADLIGAKVINGFFNMTEGIATGVTLTFSEPVDLASFTAGDVVIDGPQGKYTADSVKAVEGFGNTRFVVSFKPMAANGAYTVTVGPNIADRSGNPMDQNGDGFNGQSNDSYGMSWQVGPGGQEFTSNREYLIGDMRYIMSTIWVDKDIRITDLNVKLNIEHTAVGDLNIVLLSPSFVPYPLVVGRGGTGDNFTATVLDDQAAVAIRDGVAPFSGSFKPEVSLASLNGQNARGGWTLVVGDTKYRDSGKLVNWTLEFNAQAQPAGNAAKAAVRTTHRASATVKDLESNNIWKGGALLAMQSAPAPEVALVSEARQVTSRLSAPATARARMVSQMDQAIWSRMMEESTGLRKRVF